MRLIDSDKIEYMWKLDRNGRFHDGVTLESIINDMPIVNVNDLIIKELEKIMEYAEEESILRDNVYERVTEYSVSTTDLRNIIGKRISELKEIK